MAVHGSLGQLNDAAEDWTSYCERLVEYFKAHNIKSEDSEFCEFEGSLDEMLRDRQVRVT